MLYTDVRKMPLSIASLDFLICNLRFAFYAAVKICSAMFWLRRSLFQIFIGSSASIAKVSDCLPVKVKALRAFETSGHPNDTSSHPRQDMNPCFRTLYWLNERKLKPPGQTMSVFELCVRGPSGVLKRC